MKSVEPTTADQTATIAAQAAHVAPEKAPPKNAASRKNSASEGRKTAKGGKAGKAKAAAPKKGAKVNKKAARPERNATGAKKANAPRAESKGAKIVEMIGRPKGATLAEIMKATDWQAHSVRGFISTAAKKHSVKIDSTKNDAGDRVYMTAK